VFSCRECPSFGTLRVKLIYYKQKNAIAIKPKDLNFNEKSEVYWDILHRPNFSETYRNL